MAEKLVLFENYLSCHVCSETFRDPVSLSCSHSFCSSCLQKFWEQTKNKNCPICKRKSSKDYQYVNFALKELADSFAGRQKVGSSDTLKEKKVLEMICSKHEEVPKLFCVDEQRAVCTVCDFSLHQSHKVVPVEEAVSDLKEQLKSDLKSLQDKRNKYKQVEELYLSDDLTSVRFGDTWQQLPDNPERNTKYATVFGSEGFNSGKHSWEVEVGDHPVWNVGLVKESVERKGECPTLPKCGIWCLVYRSGKYTNVVGETVTVKKSLQRIRVQLDYDRGEVSFYDPEDMTHIYTHRDTFTEKLFPYLGIGEAGDAKTSDIKICQTEISLKTSMRSTEHGKKSVWTSLARSFQ
ncbi:nuclear factor 7, brain-like [Haplochromis burtoni]|uniref:nuclear factor 7, brain-like n=1 Tax=Haplochromis burtoni TaxID=8153 RepID=UPI001C2DD65D|nr:nuclear factor 7, brain-like [Haplochromis burtoni]